MKEGKVNIKHLEVVGESEEQRSNLWKEGSGLEPRG